MKYRWILLASLAPCVALSQTGAYAYLPAQNKFLKMKSAQVESTVIGGMVRTVTDFTYESPPSNSPQVSFNFDLPATFALGGFGYYEGDSYVAGHLQVKGSPAQVNTELGNGLRASGLVDQSSSSVYRCEIFPLSNASDLRIRVWTVGMVQPAGRKIVLLNPTLEVPVEPNTPNWTIKRLSPGPLEALGDKYSLGVSGSIAAVAQRFTDGRYYVAGYIHARKARIPAIEIEHAYYEPKSGGQGGKDVTAIVADLVRRRKFFVWASDATFGDPCPSVTKRLRVVAKIDGYDKTITVPENETLNLLGQGGDSMPMISGLQQPKMVIEDPGTVAFFGWTLDPEVVTARFQGKPYETSPRLVLKGADAARLWAQQMLATNSITEPDKVLDFSMKFGILSNVTALVAVSKSAPRVNLPTIGIDMLPIRF